MNNRTRFMIAIFVVIVLAPFIVGIAYRFSGYWASYKNCTALASYSAYDICRQDINASLRIDSANVFEIFNILFSITSLISIPASTVFVYRFSEKYSARRRHLFVIVVFVVLIIANNLFSVMLFGPPSGGLFTESDF